MNKDKVVKSIYRDIAVPSLPFGQHVIKTIDSYGDATAWIDLDHDGQRYTYSRVKELILKCANALYRDGLRRGEVVGVLSPNSYQQQILVLAIALCGATFAPFKHIHTTDEIRRQLQIVTPKLMFTTMELKKKFNEISEETKNIQFYQFGEDKHSDNCFANLIKRGSIEGVPSTDINIDVYNDVACLYMSSGTTGPPKLIQVNNYGLTITLEVFRLLWKRSRESVTYIVTSTFHLSGLVHFFSHLLQGCTQIMQQNTTVENLLGAVDKYKVTHITALPPLFLEMTECPMTTLEKYDISSLVAISTGAAPLLEEIKTNLKKKLGISAIVEVYGLTEGVPLLGSDPVLSRKGSSGFVAPNAVMKVVDITTRKSLGPWELGEMLFKGPQVATLGYANNPEATNNLFDNDGWLKTGDVGYYDDGGNVYVVDRIKDLIKAGGSQVSPTEVESVLLEHSKIADAAVIGVPDNVGHYGEVPKAYIVKRDSTLTKDEVFIYLKEILADYKQLRGGVVFVQCIPKSPSGKILRRLLRDSS